MDHPCRFNNSQQSSMNGSGNNEEFYTKFGYITSLYSYLKFNFIKSRFLLYRNLSFLRNSKRPPKQKESCDSICEYLSRNGAASSGNKSICGSKKPQGEDAVLSLTFVQFQDSCQECEWETVNAVVDVFVVHQWRKSRKSQSGRKVGKLFEGLRVVCNGKIADGDNPVMERCTFRRSQLFQDTGDIRIVYSYILFKFRVLERRACDYAAAVADPASTKDDPRLTLYAVHYDAKFPFYRLRVEDDVDPRANLLAGDYEMRLEVSADQPEGPVDDQMDLDSVAENLSDCSDRRWMPEGSAGPATASAVKEYGKWPRVLFRLEGPSDTPQEVSAFCEGAADKQTGGAAAVTPPAESLAQVTYRFTHGGRLVQWTVSRTPRCPWCGFCRPGRNPAAGLEALLVHLRTFHGRLSFRRGRPGPEGLPAEGAALSLVVALDPCYDGSVEIGLRSWPQGGALRGPGDRPPHRKLTFTHLVFCRRMEAASGKMRDTTLDVRPLARGHNRIYVASCTGLRKSVAEIDLDSEAEEHPAWLRHMYHKRIEEFSDVNPGEKRVMQLWNAHLLEHRYNGDYMVPGLAWSFLEQRGTTLRREGLRHNLLLHVANLADYGLLSQRHLVELMALFDRPPPPAPSDCTEALF